MRGRVTKAKVWRETPTHLPKHEQLSSLALGCDLGDVNGHRHAQHTDREPREETTQKRHARSEKEIELEFSFVHFNFILLVFVSIASWLRNICATIDDGKWMGRWVSKRVSE